ncbi:MAG: hypothetical protein AAF478_14700 [Pseudomonadota bacterium]
MKNGILVIIGCIRQLRENWRVVVRLVALWFALSFASSTILLFPIGQAGAGAGASAKIGNILYMFIPIAVMIIGCSSVAVGWHRFMLMGERPQRFYLIKNGMLLFVYIMRSIQIGLIGLLVYGLVYLLNHILLKEVLTLTPPVIDGVSSIVFMVMGVVFVWLSFRLSLILPALAVGIDLRLKDSFELTKVIRIELAVISIGLVLIQEVPQMVIGFAAQFAILSFGPVFWTPTIIIFEIFNWFVILLAAAILTQAFSHLYFAKLAASEE